MLLFSSGLSSQAQLLQGDGVIVPKKDKNICDIMQQWLKNLGSNVLLLLALGYCKAIVPKIYQ